MVRPGFSEPSQVLETEVPIIGGETPKGLAIKDGDATVSPQTGAFQYSHPIEVPPGRLGMQPQLALRYSSQAPIHGGLAAGWSMEIPEIRFDSSEGRVKWKQGISGSFDVPFVSTLAGGNRLVAVAEPAAADVAQTFRAQADGAYARYERLTTDNRWRVRATDGTVYDFNQPDHIVDPHRPRPPP